MLLRACIVDDEPPARRSLEWLLARHPDVTVVASCGDGVSAVDAIRAHRPDVVFLDVQMPGGDGFEMLRVLGDAAPAVVFVTAFESYAVRAFEAQAIDYLVKPFSDERFDSVLARVRDAVAHRSRSAPAARLVVRDGHRTYVFPPEEIEWLEAEDYYVRIHAGAQRPLVRRTLQSLLESLEPLGFIRVHRSAAVNLGAVRQVRPLPAGDAEVVLASGRVLRVSRSHKSSLLDRLPARP